MTPAQRQYVPPAALERDYHRDVSQNPFVAATLVCAALVGGVVYLWHERRSGCRWIRCTGPAPDRRERLDLLSDLHHEGAGRPDERRA